MVISGGIFRVSSRTRTFRFAVIGCPHGARFDGPRGVGNERRSRCLRRPDPQRMSRADARGAGRPAHVEAAGEEWFSPFPAAVLRRFWSGGAWPTAAAQQPTPGNPLNHSRRWPIAPLQPPVRAGGRRSAASPARRPLRQSAVPPCGDLRVHPLFRPRGGDAGGRGGLLISRLIWGRRRRTPSVTP